MISFSYVFDLRVLFISLHRYDDGHFYPANSDSNYDCVGEGKGVGFTVNIPWNQPQSGDAEYTAAFLRIVMPVAYQVTIQYKAILLIFYLI